MRRGEILEMMAGLGLGGMRSACDDILSAGAERRHPPQRIVGELPEAEIADKKARSMNCQLTIAKLPSAKDPADFDFSASPADEALLRGMAEGGLLDGARNAVPVGGTGTGKSRPAAAVPGAASRETGWTCPAEFAELSVHYCRSGRARLPALRPDGRPAPVPSAEPPCERTSVIAATNLSFSEWPSVFGDGKTAAALLDRPAHHCGTVETGNGSWRFRQHSKG